LPLHVVHLEASFQKSHLVRHGLEIVSYFFLCSFFIFLVNRCEELVINGFSDSELWHFDTSLHEGNSLEEILAALIRKVLLHLHFSHNLVSGHLSLVRVLTTFKVVSRTITVVSVAENCKRLVLVILLVFLKVYLEASLFDFYKESYHFEFHLLLFS
jgi:hypothetical protein